MDQQKSRNQLAIRMKCIELGGTEETVEEVLDSDSKDLVYRELDVVGSRDWKRLLVSSSTVFHFFFFVTLFYRAMPLVLLNCSYVSAF